MLDIEECKKIKKEYTKNNEAQKKIIFNVQEYPLCYIIITHGNGKSWGYFFEKNASLFLGVSNQKVAYSNLEIRQYNAFDSDYIFELVGGNEAVKNAYERYLKHMSQSHYWCRNFNYTCDLRRLFRVNPVLFANLTDCNVFRGGYKNRTFNYFNTMETYEKEFDYSKSLIKDAFKMPAKWVRLLFSLRETTSNINLYRKYNYDAEQLLELFNTYYYRRIPDDVLPNKEAGIKFIMDYNYRDYYSMRNQLSAEAKSGFPLNPTDVQKYHDKIIPIYNREQAFKRKKELEGKQKKYAEEFYKEAIKLNFKDDTYIIKACEELVDLLLEGSTLHHCVGSYVTSVSEGREYILFLRKLSDPDVPYLTIDVTPDKVVRQIHGLYNCNMDDDVRPFVEAWAEKFELNITGCSGVHCALH